MYNATNVQLRYTSTVWYASHVTNVKGYQHTVCYIDNAQDTSRTNTSHIHTRALVYLLPYMGITAILIVERDR